MTASFPLEVIDLWNQAHSYLVFYSQKSRDDVNNALVFPSATIYITYTLGDSGFFQTSRYQGIVKSTVSGVFEDLKFKISEGYKQN